MMSLSVVNIRDRVRSQVGRVERQWFRSGFLFGAARRKENVLTLETSCEGFDFWSVRGNVAAKGEGPNACID